MTPAIRSAGFTFGVAVIAYGIAEAVTRAPAIVTWSVLFFGTYIALSRLVESQIRHRRNVKAAREAIEAQKVEYGINCLSCKFHGLDPARRPTDMLPACPDCGGDLVRTAEDPRHSEASK